MAHRIERGVLAQARTQLVQPRAEILDLCGAAQRSFVLRIEPAAADLPQEFGLQRGFGGQALVPQRLHRAPGPIGHFRAGQRMRAVGDAHPG